MDSEYTGQDRISLSILWQLPLACFVLAGLTGFLYRLGLTGVDLWGLNLDNIRHAHSHLMFFSWAVPLPMYFIIQKINKETSINEPNMLMTRMAVLSLFLGIASYPFFFFYGYRPVPIAGMELPLSVIFSGLVMLCWYGFIAGYWKERKYISEELSTLFYDGALVMLFLCSLGAWGVAAVQFSGVVNPLWGKALTHFFLATFTEGWVVLVLLGLIYERVDINTEAFRISPALLIGLILLGAPLTFPYGISEGLLSPRLLISARVGGVLAAAGLLLNLYVLYRHKRSKIAWYWKTVLYLLAIKALAQLVASVLPSEFWMSAHGLRIFYLHLLLLGGFSIGLFSGLLFSKKAERGLLFVVVSIILVLVSLVWLTPFWPQSFFASWLFYATAAIAVLPVLAVSYYWYEIKKRLKNP
ncbi:MAG: hypothetical protein U5J95_11370 [Balneolaceae bacterium]|nr:hypothetical protein [Balneolaceae bacterium]